MKNLTLGQTIDAITSILGKYNPGGASAPISESEYNFEAADIAVNLIFTDGEEQVQRLVSRVFWESYDYSLTIPPEDLTKMSQEIWEVWNR